MKMQGEQQRLAAEKEKKQAELEQQIAHLRSLKEENRMKILSLEAHEGQRPF